MNTSTASQNPKNTILLVDDNTDLKEELASILTDEGYQVRSASNGKEAIDTISKYPFSLLITDIYMPEVDGLELGKYVRKTYPDMKIIFISGGGRLKSSQGSEWSLKAGKKLTNANGTLRKPFEVDEMLALIAAVLSD